MLLGKQHLVHNLWLNHSLCVSADWSSCRLYVRQRPNSPSAPDTPLPTSQPASLAGPNAADVPPPLLLLLVLLLLLLLLLVAVMLVLVPVLPMAAAAPKNAARPSARMCEHM
jgi:hypothetical protein